MHTQTLLYTGSFKLGLLVLHNSNNNYRRHIISNIPPTPIQASHQLTIGLPTRSIVATNY